MTNRIYNNKLHFSVNKPDFSMSKRKLMPIDIEDHIEQKILQTSSEVEKFLGPLSFFKKTYSPYSFKPARYFLKGIIEFDEKRYPPPILYLLEESNEEEKEETTPEIENLIKSNLTLQGILKKTPQGMIYLDIDDNYIHQLYPLISENEIKKPPYFTLFDPPHGAHCPVILSKESQKMDHFPFLGKRINFKIKGLFSVNPNSWKEVDKVFFLSIESKELEELRETYRLPAKIYGHDFHIVIGIIPTKKKNYRKKFSSMRINTAYHFI